MRGIRLGGCLIVTLLTSAVVSTPANSQQDLVGQGKANWEAMERAGRRLRGKYTLAFSQVPPKGPVTEPETGEFLIEGDNGWFLTRNVNANSRQMVSESVLGRTSEYMFRISRSQSNLPFVIHFLGKGTVEWEMLFSREKSDRHGCAVPWSANFRPLTVWLNDPHFAIREVIRENKRGQDLVRIDCTWTPRADDSDSFYRFSSMSIWCDPLRNWRVVTYECQHPHLELTTRGVVAYGTDQLGMPVPTQNSLTSNHKGDVAIWTCTYDEWTYLKEAPQNGAIGLSAFGLPEPSNREGGVVSWTWIWLLAAAAVSGLAAIFMWGKSNRGIARSGPNIRQAGNFR